MKISKNSLFLIFIRYSGQSVLHQQLIPPVNRHKKIKLNSVTVFSPSRRRKLTWWEDATLKPNALVQMVLRTSGSVGVPVQAWGTGKRRLVRVAPVLASGTLPACLSVQARMRRLVPLGRKDDRGCHRRLSEPISRVNERPVEGTTTRQAMALSHSPWNST